MRKQSSPSYYPYSWWLNWVLGDNSASSLYHFLRWYATHLQSKLSLVWYCWVLQSRISVSLFPTLTFPSKCSQPLRSLGKYLSLSLFNFWLCFTSYCSYLSLSSLAPLRLFANLLEIPFLDHRNHTRDLEWGKSLLLPVSRQSGREINQNRKLTVKRCRLSVSFLTSLSLASFYFIPTALFSYL